jgi:hypothetical protein
MFFVLNEPSGKLFNAHLLLKNEKNQESTVMILEISKDHSGKLVNAQSVLNL